VIGVPIPTQHLGGLDSLLSIVQMPRGVPVATVAIGNGENAALLAAEILAGITFETQGRCENEACPDYGREFAPGEWLEPTEGPA